MKTLKKLSLSIIGMLCIASLSLSAQNYKFAHVNTQELLQAMPQSDSARAKFQKEQRAIQQQLEEMQVELNRKYQNFQEKMDSMSNLVKKTKETELMDMQKRVQEFQQQAQQDLQRIEEELLQPIYDMMNKAIEKVGKEQGYTYVFDTSIGSVIYHSDQSEDIMPLVKKELGLTE